ncbi:uncharacterized protein LOC104904238 [Beta vulgaris subsp. vulgaris]|uniref:uncharacterized protein LOC104904238 n=1 Tax=Beta vulgaris subsp. vulgaris TaxID=3555 RepID=UPI00053F72F9|nr:uncharacterized protein LOC104904238 [Beta vulgaris subsp. vulgaris]
MSTASIYNSIPSLSSMSRSGVVVSSYALEPYQDLNQPDEFFTVYLLYRNSYVFPNEDIKSARFKLEITTPFDHSQIQVAVIEELLKLDVVGNAYLCIDVVVQSCEKLLNALSKAMIVDLRVGPEHEYHDMASYEGNKEALMTYLRIKKIIRSSNEVDIVDCLCSICLEEFESEQELANLHCSHIFHGNCLVSWTVKGKNSCPLCRRKFMYV